MKGEGIMADWTDFIKEQEKAIQEFVGEEKVIVALSGCMDSSLTTMLVHHALKKDQVSMITIDDGLRRKGEPQWVVNTFASLGIKVGTLIVNPKWLFSSLGQARNPEVKRARFRSFFYKTLASHAEKTGAKVLFQGTNRADVQETVGGVKLQHKKVNHSQSSLG